MIDSILTDNNIYIYESSNLLSVPETLKKIDYTKELLQRSK